MDKQARIEHIVEMLTEMNAVAGREEAEAKARTIVETYPPDEAEADQKLNDIQRAMEMAAEDAERELEQQAADLRERTEAAMRQAGAGDSDES